MYTLAQTLFYCREFSQTVREYCEPSVKTWNSLRVVGLLCAAVGILIYIFDQYFDFHDQLCSFFGNNPLQITEQEGKFVGLVTVARVR